MKIARFILACLPLVLASPAWAEESTAAEVKKSVKDGTRAVGHATRDTTRAIGHGTRDAAKAVGHGTRDAAKGVGQAARDTWKSLKGEPAR